MNGDPASPRPAPRGFLETRIPPPIWWLLALGAMWLLHRHAPGARFAAAGAGRLSNVLVGVLATGLAAAGFWLAIEAVRRFARLRTTVHPLHPEEATRLVVSGSYRWTRNPMYLGFLLLLAGWAVWLRDLTPWLVLPAFAAVLTRVQIVPEERALEAKFGADYRAYRSEVRRWFGRRSGGQ